MNFLTLVYLHDLCRSRAHNFGSPALSRMDIESNSDVIFSGLLYPGVTLNIHMDSEESLFALVEGIEHRVEGATLRPPA